MDLMVNNRPESILKLESLDKEKQEKVLSIKQNLELSHDGILGYGQEVSKRITDFSADILKTMKVKDNPEVEGLITELLQSLSTVDSDTLLNKKPSFIQKLFKVDEVKNFMVKYDDISSVISEVRKKLEQAQYQLKKDMELCNIYMYQNIDYINDLDCYILAGDMKVEEEYKKFKLEELECNREDMLEVHKLSLKQGEIDRLDRKLHDLKLMRAIAVQNVPQIALIRDGNGVLVEKIQSSVNSAIPLWESQMIIALQLLRQKGAITIQKGVTDTTNKLIAKNSELLKSGSIEIAQELERGIVDVDTLKKSSENLIKTLESIKTIRIEGREQRERAVHELAQLQLRLNETMMLTEG